MSDTEMCLARSDGGLLCTRPADHAGDHAAAGRDDQVIETWAKEPDVYTFETYEDAAGGFRWRLRSGNGETVAVSESYTRRADAERSVKAIKANLDRGET